MMAEQLLALGICVALLLRPYVRRGAAAAARLHVSPPASTSFSFEPLFLVLGGAAAVYGYVRLARTVERPPGWRATLFGLGAAARRRPAQLTARDDRNALPALVHLLQNVMSRTGRRRCSCSA